MPRSMHHYFADFYKGVYEFITVSEQTHACDHASKPAFTDMCTTPAVADTVLFISNYLTFSQH